MAKFVQLYDGTYIPLADSSEQPKALPTGSEPTGRVVARIAQLHTIDSDGDVTVSGAVGRGMDVLISQWGHASWQPGYLPIGKGRVTEEGDWLVMRGQFLLDTTAGRETYATLKAVGGSEWSYGYVVTDHEYGSFDGKRVRYLKGLAISEASPVLRGAGVQTSTVELSGLDPRQLEFATVAKTNERLGQGWKIPRGEAFPVVHPLTGEPVHVRLRAS